MRGYSYIPQWPRPALMTRDEIAYINRVDLEQPTEAQAAKLAVICRRCEVTLEDLKWLKGFRTM